MLEEKGKGRFIKWALIAFISLLALLIAGGLLFRLVPREFEIATIIVSVSELAF